MIRQLLESYFPFFNDLSEKDKSDLSFYSYTQSFESGQAVLDIQDTCFSLIVVLEGRLRSMLHDFTHPILLYYLNERDICTLASARELFGFSSMITLVADTDCRILKIPSWLYKDLKNRYPEMSLFLRRNFMDRYSDLLFIIKTRCLISSRQRIAYYLYNLSTNLQSETLEVTQDEISRDIDLARSQVSSILSEFEKAGYIENKWGRIIIKDLHSFSEM